MEYDLFTDRVTNSQSIILTVHENPDADCLGSEIALYRYLKEIGKDVRAINCDPTPESLTFLDQSGDIEVIDENNLPAHCDLFILIDTAVPSRCQKVWDTIAENADTITAIDHHIAEEGSVTGLVDEKAAAAGAVLYSYFAAIGHVLTPPIAEPLMYAIGSDTGWMRFANTSPLVLTMMGTLSAAAGIPLSQGYDKFNNTWSEEQFRFHADVMATMELTPEGAAFIDCNDDMLEPYPSLKRLSEASDRFVDDLKRLIKAEIMVLLRQSSSDNGIRASLRSKGNVNVERIAHTFGGGGHKMAAGCHLPAATITEAKKLVIAEMKKQL